MSSRTARAYRVRPCLQKKKATTKPMKIVISNLIHFGSHLDFLNFLFFFPQCGSLKVFLVLFWFHLLILRL